jgi:hypothetical protein
VRHVTRFDSALSSLELGFLVVLFCLAFGGHGEMGNTPARRAALRASASGFLPALRVYGSSKNRKNVIFGTSSKSSPWPREQGPTRLRVPRQERGRKGAKMNEETKIQKTEVNGKSMISWAALLAEAVKEPGFIHKAYSRFHNYSLGNQLLAMFQCVSRGIQAGPMATFLKWKELGRHVKKGERALILCVPMTCQRTKVVAAEDGTEKDEVFAFTHFTYKSHWFVLSQTEGADYVPPEIPYWQRDQALAKLNVQHIRFESLDGNVQGYARTGRRVAVNPLAALPYKTLFHELAHVLLGHCDETDLSEIEIQPRDVREVEAEAVALLCCESLNLPGSVYSRGYIQAWGHGHAITQRSAQRIFHAADQILWAGQSAEAAASSE